jgi:hypothetical protein
MPCKDETMYSTQADAERAMRRRKNQPNMGHRWGAPGENRAVGAVSFSAGESKPNPIPVVVQFHFPQAGGTIQ